MDWSQWVQNVAGTALDRYTATKQLEAQTDAMRLQALGESGYYLEGQRGTLVPVPRQTIGGIPTGWLLVGAAVVAVVLLKD